MRFDAAIKIRGINPYVLVNAARAKSIKPGWKKPIPVLEIARYLVSLKSQDARSRNLEKVLRMLGGQKGRFMARDWN
jgi:hypothetical protein